MPDENNGSSGLQARINTLGAAKADLTAQLATANEQLAQLTTRAGRVDELDAQLASVRGELATATKRGEHTEAMIGAGVTDRAARDFLMFQHQSSGNGAEFGEWLSNQQANASGFTATIFGQQAQAGPAPPRAPETPKLPAQPAKPTTRIDTERGSVNRAGGTGRFTAEHFADPNQPWGDLKKQLAGQRRRG